MPKLLTTDQIEAELKQLEFNWEYLDKKIQLAVETKDFSEAAWLVAEIARVAESLNHHPDLSITDYKHLMVTTYTHSESGVTGKDLELVEKIDALITRIK